MRLVTHFDLDGAGCEIVLRKFLKFEKSYACGYTKFQKQIDIIKTGEKIMFADVSLTVKQVEQMDSRTKNWYIIDHHEDTALLKERWPSKVFFDIEYSGTELCRQLMKRQFPGQYSKIWNDDMIRLVALTNVYDLWKIDHDRWREAYNLNILFWHYSIWKFVKHFEDGVGPYSNEDKNIILNQLKIRSDLLKESTKFDVYEKTAIFLVDNEIINDMTLIYRDYELYFMVYMTMTNDRFCLSIRAKGEDADINTIIATLPDRNYLVMNAGGHKLAGGVTFEKKATLDDVMDVCADITTEYWIF